MDNIEIENVTNEIDIINTTNDISIEDVENEISLVQEENNIEIEVPENNLELVFNERGPRGPQGPKGDTALFYFIVDQEKLDGYTQTSTMENDVKYTYIRDADNIVIETIKEEL